MESEGQWTGNYPSLYDLVIFNARALCHIAYLAYSQGYGLHTLRAMAISRNLKSPKGPCVKGLSPSLRLLGYGRNLKRWDVEGGIQVTSSVHEKGTTGTWSLFFLCVTSWPWGNSWLCSASHPCQEQQGQLIMDWNSKAKSQKNPFLLSVDHLRVC